jgi:acyl-CoA thioester hydrolase
MRKTVVAGIWVNLSRRSYLDHVPTTTEVRVRYAETDQMGVAYHANYLIWCEIGRTDFIRKAGMSYADMERDGVGLAVSDASVRYHASARYDDLIIVETSLTEVKSRAVTFRYTMTRADSGVKLATASTTLVAIDAEGKLRAMPPAIRALLEASIG